MTTPENNEGRATGPTTPVSKSNIERFAAVFTPREKPTQSYDPFAPAKPGLHGGAHGRRTPYKTTEDHDRLQAKFGVMCDWDLARLLRCTGVVKDCGPSRHMPARIVLEKPVVCDRYSRANDWRMDAVIESEALHVIVELKTAIDSMGELLGQCQRYMRHYRPGYLAEGEFCPVIVACPFIERYIVEVLEAQGFYWLANERWEEFFGWVAA